MKKTILISMLSISLFQCRTDDDNERLETASEEEFWAVDSIGKTDEESVAIETDSAKFKTITSKKSATVKLIDSLNKVFSDPNFRTSYEINASSEKSLSEYNEGRSLGMDERDLEDLRRNNKRKKYFSIIK